jgi:hypothetical protein
MMHVLWIDHQREPQERPDPDFPEGIDLDTGSRPACKAELPYPAKRCGVYFVDCDVCGTTVAVTTAGRPDDPKSVMVPCKK